jgi:hypothetical protein
VSAIRDEIRSQSGRLVALWPALRNKPDVVAEIERAVLRHEPRLVTEDITHGFDQVIDNSPTSGWPPGPHEVLGCVLDARRARTNGKEPTPRKFGGLTFAEWWHTLPADQRSHHGTLQRMMTRGLDSVDDGAAPVVVPLDFTPSAGSQPAGDTIQWEAA